MKDIYVPDAIYEPLIAALATIATTQSIDDVPSQIHIALGEIGGIWPESTKADAEAKT